MLKRNQLLMKWRRVYHSITTERSISYYSTNSSSQRKPRIISNVQYNKERQFKVEQNIDSGLISFFKKRGMTPGYIAIGFGAAFMSLGFLMFSYRDHFVPRDDNTEVDEGDEPIRPPELNHYSDSLRGVAGGSRLE